MYSIFPKSVKPIMLEAVTTFYIIKYNAVAKLIHTQASDQYTFMYVKWPNTATLAASVVFPVPIKSLKVILCSYTKLTKICYDVDK